jgi:hypothetical protein
LSLLVEPLRNLRGKIENFAPTKELQHHRLAWPQPYMLADRLPPLSASFRLAHDQTSISPDGGCCALETVVKSEEFSSSFIRLGHAGRVNRPGFFLGGKSSMNKS